MGDLYAWRLLRTHDVTMPVSAFTSVTMPANGSARTRAELDYLLALQQSHTPDEQARRGQLMQSALEMAWSRELLGVHYPSDSEAGRIFAQDFVRFLFENPAFRQDFEAVRQEWGRDGAPCGRGPRCS